MRRQQQQQIRMASAVCVTAVRFGPLEGMLRKFTRMGKEKVARMDERHTSKKDRPKDPHEYTSKDIDTNPVRAGSGFDPVYAYHAFGLATGPLQRKRADDLTSYMDVDEQAKWMDAKQAAKRLGIREEALETLTPNQVEEAFIKLYKGSPGTRREEISVAAEVLMEYLASSAFEKKNRKHYRYLLERARMSVDHEMEKEKQANREKIMLFVAAIFTAACAIVIFIAFSRRYITGVDASTIGNKLHDYYTITFTQPPNMEPAPDYQTRYFYTPTSIDMDKRSGRYDDAFEDEASIRIREEKEAYDRREEAELLRMLNDDTERAQREKGKGTATTNASSTSSKTDEGEEDLPQDAKGFRSFARVISQKMGGGTRFERLTNDTSARAEELRAIQERLKTKNG